MKLQEEFSLESILSVITGINCTNDFEIYELYWFMFEDEFIDDSAIQQKREIARRHILNIHPELNSIVFDINDSLNNWIEKQKNLFGETLPISIIGEPIVKLQNQLIMK